MSTPAARRFRGDSGAIVAEAALLMPFFLTLIFGMLEFGGAFRDYLTVANATANGARQTAIQGNSSSADWYILNTIKQASAAMPQSQIQAIVVYDASAAPAGINPASVTSPAQISATCLTASVANKCNFYGPSLISQAFAATTPPSNWQDCNAGDPEASFCPANRNVLIAAPGPDYVGVYVKVLHPWITGLFGSNITLTSNTVIQLEPQKLTSS